MNFKERDMIRYLREEYDSRLKHYLSEIEIKDDSDNDLIASAEGLKVKDSAGYVYTIGGVMNDEEGKVIVRLIAPEDVRSDYEPQGSSNFMFEDDGEEVSSEKSRDKSLSKKKGKEESKDEEDLGMSSDLIARNKKAAFKRSFDIDASSEPFWKEKGVSKGEEGSSYIDIPIEDFEKRFTL